VSVCQAWPSGHAFCGHLCREAYLNCLCCAHKHTHATRPRDSWHDAPFFAAGKAMGDKRATMAEKRFNRPLKRVLIANAGLVR
jgi:hypothetical protein